MKFTIKQYGSFAEEVFFEMPDEIIKEKLEEYKRRGLYEDEARDALEDFITRNRWDYQTDYSDRDDDVDDWDYQDDFSEGLDEVMEDYYNDSITLGEMWWLL